MAIRFNGVAGGIVLILILLLSCQSTLAQTTIVIDPSSKFDVPSHNGVVRFAVNGNYSSAVFDGTAWSFTNLQLNGSNPITYLTISAENSNITVYSYHNSTNVFPSSRISYNAQGLGTQILNLGVGSGGGIKVNWVVYSNATFISNGWSVSHNGTVTISGLTGNVSVIYFGFTNLTNSNLPFYEQHSVAIAVAISFAVVVGVAVAVNVWIEKRSAPLGSESSGEAYS